MSNKFNPDRPMAHEATGHESCEQCGRTLSVHYSMQGGYVSCTKPPGIAVRFGLRGYLQHNESDTPVQQRLLAPDILKRAAKHMEDRAAARDQPGGERSMARTVAAFNAITGHAISERDGWMFMVMLKAARACTTATGLPDDYEDLAAYAALAGEAP